MPFAELNGVTLHYDLNGPEDGPVVVLSNSLGTTLNMWDAQVAAFSAHMRVLRYDTRGHGLSSAPAGPYSLAMLGNDALRLLDLLNISKTSICGVSLGGMTALWLAIHAPERVACIVAANTAARIGTADSWNARIDQVMQHGMKSLTQGILERWYTPPFRVSDPATLAETTRMLEGTSAEGYSACCAAIRDMDQTAEVGRITAPTLLIAGIGDPVTPPSDLKLLEASIRGARYIELRAAHLSNIEAATAFNAAVMPFIKLHGA